MRKLRQGECPEVCSAPEQPTSPAAKGPTPCLTHPPSCRSLRTSLSDLGNWFGGEVGRRESGQQIGFPESFRVIPSPPEDVLTQPMLLQGSSRPTSDPASGLPAPLPTLVSLSSLLSSSLALLTLLQGLEPRPRSPPLTPTCTVALGRPLPLSEPPWPSWGGWLPESRPTFNFQASWPLELFPPFSVCTPPFSLDTPPSRLLPALLSFLLPTLLRECQVCSFP